MTLEQVKTLWNRVTDKTDTKQDKVRAKGTNYMGYKTLDPSATFASQVTATDTIYVVQTDFDLGGSNVTMPSGCVLRFDGGSLKNGTLNGNNTVIEAGDYQIFAVGTIKYRGYTSSKYDGQGNVKPQTNWGYSYVSETTGDDLEIAGTWANAVVNPNWVGLNDIDPTKDSRLKIQRFINLHDSTAVVSMPKNTYYTYGSIQQTRSIDFNGSTLICCKYSDIYDSSIELPSGAYDLPDDDIRGLEMVYGLIQMRTTAANTFLKNVTIDGNRSDGSNGGNYEAIKYGMAGLYCIYNQSEGLLLENVTLKNSPACGIIGGNPLSATFKNFTIDGVTEHGIYAHFQNSRSLTFENCTFHNCGDDQRMVDARRGFGYIIKHTANNQQSVVFSFTNCDFSNTASLNYDGGTPPYTTPTGQRGGIESESGDFAFDNCSIPSYLYHVIQYDTLGHWDFKNCTGIGFIPTEAASQPTNKRNIIVTCDGCTGHIRYCNLYKSIKNCIFSTTYGGDYYGTFYDSTYNDMPVVIEDCTITPIPRISSGVTYFHKPMDIAELVFNRCNIYQRDSITGEPAIFNGATNVSLSECVIDTNAPFSANNSTSYTFDNCTVRCSWYLLRLTSSGSATIKNLNVIGGSLFYGHTYPTNFTDNTDRTIDGSGTAKNSSQSYMGIMCNTYGIIARAESVSSSMPKGAQVFITDRNNQLAVWTGSRWVNALGKKVTFQTTSSTYRPNSGFTQDDLGYLFFDKTLAKPLILKAVSSGGAATWAEFDGAAAGVARSGDTASRPASTDIYIGFQYWDTDLDKMIAWSGTAWVNLDEDLVDNVTELIEEIDTKQDKLTLATTIPNDGALPNVIYDLGTTDIVNITLDDPDDEDEHYWCIRWTCLTSNCSITLPSDCKLPSGLNLAPFTDRRFELIIDSDHYVSFNCWD